ncbi:uncharacterized protein LOC135805286 [Sycon ciliatum]|uniref:uncharacterized protein LOC135805286 n=1 Tax=Sycon ciliatum TaxID=27933 RepID=UPI0031F6E6D8
MTGTEYKVARYKTDEFWKRLESEDLEERLATVCDAKNAVIGLICAKCYFVDRGIYSLMSRNIQEYSPGEDAVTADLRVQSTLVMGLVCHSIEHAQRAVRTVSIDLLTKQLCLEGPVVAATLSMLHGMCICSEGRTAVIQHAANSLFGFLQPVLPMDDAACRRTELAARIFGILSIDPEFCMRMLQNDVLKHLVRILDTKPATFLTYTSLQCAASTLAGVVPAGARLEDFKVLAEFHAEALFSTESLSCYLSDVHHIPFQVCAAQIMCYVVMTTAAGIQPGAPSPHRDFIRQRLLPLLSRISLAEQSPVVTQLECHSLHLICLLIRCFPVDVGEVVYQTEALAQNVLKRIHDAQSGRARGACGVAWTFVANALRCLAEMCACSEENCLRVSKMPGIQECVRISLDKRCVSIQAKESSILLMLAFSRVVEVCRSRLVEMKVWEPVAEVLKNASDYMNKAPHILVGCCRLLANILLPFSGMQGLVAKAGALYDIKAIMSNLVNQPDLCGLHRNEILCEVLLAFRNAIFQMVSEDLRSGLTPLIMAGFAWDLFVFVDPERSFSEDVCLAAMKLLAQVDMVAPIELEPAKNGLDNMYLHLRKGLDKGPWNSVIWTLYALNQIVKSRGVQQDGLLGSNTEMLLRGILDCLKHPRHEVQASALRLAGTMLNGHQLSPSARERLQQALTETTRNAVQFASASVASASGVVDAPAQPSPAQPQ